MTVQELIQILQSKPQHLPVVYYDGAVANPITMVSDPEPMGEAEVQSIVLE